MDWLIWDICSYIQSSFDGMYDINQFTISLPQNNHVWILKINRIFAKSDNEHDIIRLKQIINVVFNEIITSENFKNLKQYKKDATTENDLYKIGINEIIKDVNKDIPLRVI